MKLKQFLLSIALVLPLSAQAVTLTFDDATTAPLNPYSSDGYTLQAYYYYNTTYPRSIAFTPNVNRSSYVGQFNYGEDYLTMNHGTDGAATIVNDAGALFDIHSLDLGSGARGEYVDVTVTGLDAGGNVIATTIFGSMEKLTNVVLTGYTGLDTLEITSIRTGTTDDYRFSFDNIDITESIVAPQFSCVGFDAPMNNGAVKVKKNRVLPLKAELFDEVGNLVDDLGINSAPVLTVMYNSGLEPADDVTGEALAAGEATDGNQFEYNLDTNQWQFNLKTKNYTAAGTYSVSLTSGDATEYGIDPACQASFVIQ